MESMVSTYGTSSTITGYLGRRLIHLKLELYEKILERSLTQQGLGILAFDPAFMCSVASHRHIE